MTVKRKALLVIVPWLFVEACALAAPARADITAVYPKKICYSTSDSKIKSGGDPVRQKPVLWGAASFGYCVKRRASRHTGDVVSYAGPLSRLHVTDWGKRNGWEYDGQSKRVIKCINPHKGACDYVRVKLWYEFDKEVLDVSVGHHTMKFSLLVGSGLEIWK